MFNRNYRSCDCMNNNEYDPMETQKDNNNCGCNDEESIYDNSCGCFNNSNDEYMSSCACGFNEPYSVFPTDPTIAESYVPAQNFTKAYKSCIGLKKGTIFPELVNTYCPGQSMEEIAYLRDTNKIGEGCNQ